MKLNNLHQSWLNKRGVADEVIMNFGLSTHVHPTIGECIKIPYNETHSKYRRDPLDERKPKYLYDAGGKVTLYGYDKLPLNTKRVVITEGELDCLVLWSLNIPAVSSTGGAMSFQEDWADLLRGYEVFLCFDNDPAGADGMVKVLKYLPDAKVIFIPEQPDVKDVSDFVARGGDFHALLTTARSYASTQAVEEDKLLRAAQWLPVRFHNAYLEANRPQLPTNTQGATRTYSGDDKVLRSKAYPMTELITFTRRQAICPWHNEKTPSLHYYPKTNSAYCFGACGRAYDSIDAYRKLHGCGFVEAVDELSKL